jgi:hypothetical protein
MMSDWDKKDYLVFEKSAKPIPAYTTFLTGYNLVGHVRAVDEEAASKVAAGVTGRVKKYAVLEVTIIDLAADEINVIKVVGDQKHR